MTVGRGRRDTAAPCSCRPVIGVMIDGRPDEGLARAAPRVARDRQARINTETPSLSSPIRSGTEHANQVFRGVRLERAELVSGEFDECTFIRCSFVESVFQECRLVDCVFEQCDLSLIRLPGSTFCADRFEDSKLTGVNWTDAHWPEVRLWEPIGFTRCLISHSTFMGLDLARVRITDCIAQDVDFREADLSQADFAGTDLSGSLFLNTNLTEADLSCAMNYRIDPRTNTLKAARFSLPEAISLLQDLDIVLTGWES